MSITTRNNEINFTPKVFIKIDANAKPNYVQPYHIHFTTLKNKICPVCKYLDTIKPKFDFLANQQVTNHENIR